MSDTSANRRIWEIDLLRGIAIILMVLFHLLYNLKEFYGFNIDYQSGIIFFIGKASALLFIILTGISCSFSKNNFQRGLKILFYAFLITFVTYLFDSERFITFGILHFLAISIFLYIFVKNLDIFSLFIIGSLVILIGYMVGQVSISHNYFLMFGLTSSSYMSFDYYPLLPYFGVFLYGVALKKILYPSYESVLPIVWNIKPLGYLGRKSLYIYLIHQPILLVFLSLMEQVNLL
ncbi:DUF1624 domain-containing protein [Heliorestis acidaminivorans]|uniref:DUF1624 domain-containing protein n=1 Tax=Heliorestis acidaminivorans TaxID=553427 RepID=A0A6I0EPE7_9FIRM|nr:heparan-alpha-glucosaminide N-acetyltransferase [Heliorestis acidaminivorans]KAB2950941.1 DUF1624 domain-containing protein [Heliorestis acidaminivorans]